MNYCVCHQVLDRVNKALQQLVNTMASAREASSRSLTDSGETLSNNAPENESNGGLSTNMIIIGMLIIMALMYFLRAAERNNNQTNRNENNSNSKEEKSLTSRKF